MKLDKTKLRSTIKQTIKLQREAARSGAPTSDLALYATYLYCVASQGHGRIHMKWWNKEHPAKWDLKITEIQRFAWPRAFGVEVSTLEDQTAFIAQAAKYLTWLQEHTKKYTPASEFWKLPLTFELPEEPALPEAVAV